MKIFNDNIYGRIEIPDYCVSLIDTIEFQRLRNLKQLGLTNYVFCGATHTRFEHSIGVCWLSGEWAKHLQRKCINDKQTGLITDNDIKLVMISGLLHDIGHGPFSHTFERFIEKTRSNVKYHHEDMTIKIVKKLLANEPYCDDVCKIISGPEASADGCHFLGQIVHNTINGLDADKLDYFIRDSRCTSFPIGCDWKRIIYESSLLNNEIVFPYKMVGDIFNLYQTRFRLYKEVYYHKTVCKIEDMLLDILIKADVLGVFLDGSVKSLQNSIDNVETFIQTQDDIIGQIERFGYKELVDELNKIKTRKFEETKRSVVDKREPHYGMYNKNPLLFVKFIDKNGLVKQIENDLLETICPRNFMMEI